MPEQLLARVTLFDITKDEPDQKMGSIEMVAIPRVGETFELEVQMLPNHQMATESLASYKESEGVYRVVLVEHVHVIQDWNKSRQYVRVYLHKTGRPLWHNVRRGFVEWCKSLGA